MTDGERPQVDPSRPVSTPTGIRGDSPNLDLLRSMAVLFVVLCHLPIVGELARNREFHPGALGLLGVVIFFVHTCLVLLLSLDRQMQSQGPRRFASVFYIRRAFRIYPLSMIVVASVAFSALLSGERSVSMGTLVSNFLLVQNLTGHESIPAPLWSLPFEIQMYLLLPALFLGISRIRSNALFLVGLLWVGMIGLILALWRLNLNYHLIKYFPCFLCGALAYALRGTRRTWHPLILFGYVCIAALVMPYAVSRGARENAVAWPVCLGLGLLIPRCREIDSKILSLTGKTIARYSYGIYLIHGSAIAVAFGSLSQHHPILQWSGLVALTAGLSWLAYHLIEQPGINLGLSLAKRWAVRGPQSASRVSATLTE